MSWEGIGNFPGWEAQIWENLRLAWEELRNEWGAKAG